MSAVAPPQSSGPSVSVFEHDEAIKKHFSTIGFNALLTTYAAFEYLEVLGSNIFGAIVLQVQASDGIRYAVIPLATGDPTDKLSNTGFSFIASATFANLDNKLVSFKIANASEGGPGTATISFTSTDGSNTNIAGITLTNGQLGWLGSTGYTTFFKAPAPPTSK